MNELSVMQCECEQITPVVMYVLGVIEFPACFHFFLHSFFAEFEAIVLKVINGVS